MLQGGFEPSIPASERPQTHALYIAATVIGEDKNSACEKLVLEIKHYIKYKGNVGYCKMGT